MKNLVNNVQLIGNLGSDPELLTVPAGTSMAKFSLATNEYYQNKKGEKVTEITWHNIVAWGPQEECIAAIFQKGMQVAISLAPAVAGSLCYMARCSLGSTLSSGLPHFRSSPFRSADGAFLRKRSFWQTFDFRNVSA